MFKNLLSLIAAFLFCCFSLQAALKSKPNIIVILVDDLGYGDLSCQGGTDIETPNIDKLFDQGMRFNQFYANSTMAV